MPGATLDTGALIAIERGDRRLQALLGEATVAGAEIAVMLPLTNPVQPWATPTPSTRLFRENSTNSQSLSIPQAVSPT